MSKKKTNKKVNSFRERVLRVVIRIKKGKALTYGEAAKRAGKPGAARAVGAIMRSNFDSTIPCHRVVMKSSIGGYNRGVKLKRQLLKREGYLS